MNHIVPKIEIIDDLPPEDVAMLQALYSRSPASVHDHLAKLASQGSGPFMERYYVGYGHASIGDCGSTTLFIENVTMLIAKAIQDWPLYSGQECSTRYMDFSTAPFCDPVGTKESGEIQMRWRAFYMAAREPTEAHVREMYPQKIREDTKDYDRAVKARVFDILRSFLPAGASTSLSWHTNLRQASDHLKWLLAHPDKLVRATADQIAETLAGKYSASFRRPKPEHAEYYEAILADTYYNLAPKTTEPRVDAYVQTNIDDRRYLRRRPKGAELPWYFAEKGLVRSQFMLDFGSFRDLQRHRNGTIRMPLLSTDWGFHPWYLAQLPEDTASDARALLADQKEAINALSCSDMLAQNYVAMGYQVPCDLTQPLPAFVYRLELRSGKTVHPTLREVVLEEVRQFRQLAPDVMLHVDEDPDSWTIRRGKQTIEERP